MEFITTAFINLVSLTAAYSMMMLLALLCAFVLWIASASRENGFWSTLFMLTTGSLLVARYPGIVSFFTPLMLCLIIPVYVAVGVIWARFKWSVLINTRFDYIKGRSDNWFASMSLNPNFFTQAFEEGSADWIKQGQKKDHYTQYMRDMLSSDARRRLGDDPTLDQVFASLAPDVRDNKSRITMWMTYWPITMVWYLLADLMMDLYNQVYNAIAGSFQRMSINKFKEFNVK